MPTIFAQYAEPLRSEDRAALEGAGFKVYENGVGVGALWPGDQPGPTEFKNYQVIRLEASDPDDAEQQIIGALGRRPAELKAFPGTS